MVLIVAYEVAGSREPALVLETKVAVAARGNDRRIKIDQMRIVRRVALRRTDAVRVVANIARRIRAADVFIVFRKAFIVQNAVTTVAVVAQRIIRRAFRRVVDRGVISDQYRVER